MPIYVEKSKCITSESIKQDKRKKRIKFFAKLLVVIPLILRLLQELGR